MLRERRERRDRGREGEERAGRERDSQTFQRMEIVIYVKSEEVVPLH